MEKAEKNAVKEEFLEPLSTANEPSEFVKPCLQKPDGFILPYGVPDPETSEIHRELSVRALTGDERSRLGSPSVKKNLGKLITEFIVNGIESVGGLKFDHTIAKKMLIGDRETALIAVSAATYGEIQKIDSKCPYCELPMEHNVDLRRIPIFSPVHIQRDGTGFTFEIKALVNNAEIKAKFKYPNGALQEWVSPIGTNNPLKAQIEMMEKLCVNWNGNPVAPGMFRDGSARLTNDLEQSIAGHAFGPDTDILVKCSGCESEYVLSLDLMDFVFPSSAKMLKKRSGRMYSL